MAKRYYLKDRQVQELNDSYIILIGHLAMLMWVAGWYIFFNAYRLFSGSNILWLDILFGNFGVIIGIGLMVLGSMFLWEKLDYKIR